ncbi:MAG TPA: flagellar basal-body rod protein FlgF [bacterium]|nr:flagellar basal-body rod protein FlgF [bacterium]
MPSGLYIAASGMNATMTQQDVISNNLANVDTVGFKGNRAVDAAFPTYLIARVEDQQIKTPEGNMDTRPAIGLMGGGVIPMATPIDYSQGSRLQTQNPLDMALTGPGFFTVMNPDGQLLYTRDGSFNLDADGRLVTKDGLPVMGHNGQIFIDGKTMTVDQQGNITVDGKAVDQLAVVQVKNQTQLEKVGHSLFKGQTPLALDKWPDNILVQQGFLEQSNVNSVEAMVQMINVTRSYEMNSRVVSTYDNIMGQAASEIGTLRV